VTAQQCRSSARQQPERGRHHHDYDNGTPQEQKAYFESLLAPSLYRPQYHLLQLLFFIDLLRTDEDEGNVF
jgi:hypothetical protein